MTDTSDNPAAPELPAFRRDDRGRIDSSITNYITALSPPYSAVVYRRGGLRGVLGYYRVGRPEEWFPFLEHHWVELHLHLRGLGFRSVGKGKVVNAVKWLARPTPQVRSF